MDLKICEINFTVEHPSTTVFLSQRVLELAQQLHKRELSYYQMIFVLLAEPQLCFQEVHVYSKHCQLLKNLELKYVCYYQQIGNLLE